MLLAERMSDDMRGIHEKGTSPHFKENKTRPESHIDTTNEELLNFLKIMFHDFRGSLLSILAILKLLNRGHYGEINESVSIKLEELFEKVRGLIGMMEEYLNEVFSFNGDLKIEHEVLDLREDILNPVLKELSTELRDRHIVIDNRLETISKNPILLKGSRVWLKAVFRNLLNNAINHGDMGGAVAIGFEKEDSMCRVNIYNSGKPIPEELRDGLFTKFSPKRDNSIGGSKGLGLGLFFVKIILQKLGGDIWYEAKEHGSNFIMTIPIERK